MQKYSKCFGKGQNFLSLFHVSGNFKRKFFEKKFGMTKIDRHFLLPNVVICFTLYTREIARIHLSFFVACKCVIYFRVPYLIPHCNRYVYHGISTHLFNTWSKAFVSSSRRFASLFLHPKKSWMGFWLLVSSWNCSLLVLFIMTVEITWATHHVLVSQGLPEPSERGHSRSSSD